MPTRQQNALIQRLFEAVRERRASEVQTLLSQGVLPNARSTWPAYRRGASPLHSLAIGLGSRPIVLTADPHANARSLVSLLVEHGADLEKTLTTTQQGALNGSTPLILAASTGRLDVLDALVEAGADLNARTKSGATPLIVALFYGHVDAARRLLAAGARVDGHALVDPRLHGSPFSFSINPLSRVVGHPAASTQVLDLLLDIGLGPKSSLMVNADGTHFLTALSASTLTNPSAPGSSQAMDRLILRLLDHGLDPWLDPTATRTAAGMGHTVFSYLLEKFPRVSLDTLHEVWRRQQAEQWPMTAKQQLTLALTVAVLARRYDLDTLGTLKGWEANSQGDEIVDSDKVLSFFLDDLARLPAMESSFLSTLKLLLTPANVNVENYQGAGAPLMQVLRQGSNALLIPAVKALLQAGADPNRPHKSVPPLGAVVSAVFFQPRSLLTPDDRLALTALLFDAGASPLAQYAHQYIFLGMDHDPSLRALFWDRFRTWSETDFSEASDSILIAVRLQIKRLDTPDQAGTILSSVRAAADHLLVFDYVASMMTEERSSPTSAFAQISPEIWSSFERWWLTRAPHPEAARFLNDPQGFAVWCSNLTPENRARAERWILQATSPAASSTSLSPTSRARL